MDRPLNLTIPTLHAGNTALILWDAVDTATTYQLDGKLNTDSNFAPIFGGSTTSFQDFLPESATTAEYRVQAAIDNERTWDELDALERTWDELDALDWMWFKEFSEFTASGAKEVIPNRPPIISGQDTDLGTRYRGFDTVFSVTDPDPNNTVNITARLDTATIFNMPNAQQGANYTITLTDAQIFSMPDQSRHSIVITATDNKGASATRTHTFTAVEDLVTTAVFYILRNGQPIARLGNAQQWTDYMEVGTHRYVVRGVDRYGNFSDSNEVTVTITLQYATLALVSSPERFINLIARRDERPQMGRNYTVNFSETWYEGRAFPVYDYSGQKRNAIPLGFTTTTLQEQQTLFSMISRAQPFIYRDQYSMRVVGVIPELTNDFQGRFAGQEKDAIIDFNITVNQVDFNEVIEYD